MLYKYRQVNIRLVKLSRGYPLIVHYGRAYRRKAFWVAKQLLQLGMGDAFDDWLIEKIQHLRRGSVVASGIRRLEQVISYLNSILLVPWASLYSYKKI